MIKYKILEKSVLILLLLLLILGCQKKDDDIEEKNTSSWNLNCSNTVSSNCKLIEGNWYFLNSGNYPILNYKNSISFDKQGNVDWNYLGYNKGKYQVLNNCNKLQLRSTENEIIREVDIVELSDTILRLMDFKLCGNSPCLFVRNGSFTSNFQNNLKTKLCNISNCAKTCNDFSSGFECSIDFLYVDRPGNTELLSSVKNSLDQIVILSRNRLLLIDSNLNIIWEYKDLPPFFGSPAFSHLKVVAVDSENNIYLPYNGNNSIKLLKISKTGNLVFDKLLVVNQILGANVNDYSIKYFNDNLYIYSYRNQNFLKINLQGELKINKKTVLPSFMHPDFIISKNEIIFVNGTFKNILHIFDLNLNYKGKRNIMTNSAITDLDFTWVKVLSIHSQNSNIIISGRYGNTSDSKNFGTNRIGIVINGDKIIDFVESFNFENNINHFNITHSGAISISKQDFDYYIALSSNHMGNYIPKFRYIIDINKSDKFSGFRPIYSYEINNKILVLGTGKRFTYTVLGYRINLNSLYPSINCN